MIATWMVSLSGWLLVMLLVLAAVGAVMCVLIIADSVAHRRDTAAARERARQERGTR